MAEVSRRQEKAFESGVSSNERLTALTGAMLLLLLALMGITVLSVKRLLPEHFFVGFLLIPPLALKMASTGYRFVRYYTGDPRYRLAGPPAIFMRLLGPVVVIATVALFATGIEMWLFGLRFGSIWVEAHKLSFNVWWPATTIHVLGHLGRAGRAAADAISAPRSSGALTRRSVVIGSLVAGVALAIASLSYATPFTFFGGDG
jgi:hypothetical protein